MKVVFSRIARADLAAIEDFIAQDNAVRASSFTDRLAGACEAIADAPHAYPAVLNPDAAAGLRKKVFSGYLIVYSTTRDAVTIVRVLHGARDIDHLLSYDV